MKRSSGDVYREIGLLQIRLLLMLKSYELFGEKMHRYEDIRAAFKELEQLYERRKQREEWSEYNES